MITEKEIQTIWRKYVFHDPVPQTSSFLKVWLMFWFPGPLPRFYLLRGLSW